MIEIYHMVKFHSLNLEDKVVLRRGVVLGYKDKGVLYIS